MAMNEHGDDHAVSPGPPNQSFDFAFAGVEGMLMAFFGK
jgi:hypothetical protein